MQERRESERREFELASRLPAIVESSELAIVGLTRDNVVASWNAAAERMYGYAASEIIGRSASLLWPPDAAAEAAEVVGRAQRGERIGQFEGSVRCKDGAWWTPSAACLRSGTRPEP